MADYDLLESRATLSGLIERALDGETVTVARQSETNVELRAVRRQTAPASVREALYEEMRDRLETTPMANYSAVELIRMMREESEH